MSAAAAAAAPSDVAPKKGKKMLIIILAVVVLVLAAGGGGAVWFMKKKAAEAAAAAEEGGEVEHEPAHKEAAEHHTPPVFMPLDPFTVNLADREADRYAQIGVTLELDDAKSTEELKAYMPAIRNNILMVLAHKTSADLVEREGKEKLAREIRREALKPLGIELEDEEEEGVDVKPAKKKKKRAEPIYPIKAVQFSNFIIQ